MEKCFALALTIVLCHFALSLAIAGTATYYNPIPHSRTLCFRHKDMGTMIAQASRESWDNGDACGQNYRVTCTTNPGLPYPCKGESVVVKIVDYHYGWNGATIELSAEAFSTIADLNVGNIQIDYIQV